MSVAFVVSLTKTCVVKRQQRTELLQLAMAQAGALRVRLPRHVVVLDPLARTWAPAVEPKLSA